MLQFAELPCKHAQVPRRWMCAAGSAWRVVSRAPQELQVVYVSWALTVLH